MLTLTEQAAMAIQEILAESNTGPDGGLRITGTSANGETQLELSLAEAPVEGDEVVQDGGATLFLDEVAAAALRDKTLDVETHGDHFHFSLGDQDGMV